ncbi:hypothetical protein Aperf_G00000095060 [Anoplocephala perfoliata]
MSRIFYRISSYFLWRSRKLTPFYRIRQVVTGASLFSLAIGSAHLVLPFDQQGENSGKLLTVGPDFNQGNQVNNLNLIISQPALVRLFLKFASVEVDGEVFMTPRDFIDCVVGSRPPVSARRHVIDIQMAEQLLSKTPRLSSNCGALFHNLDRSGLISCSEYLFLLSVLSNNSHHLRVIFNMFDKDFSETIDKSEFLQVIKLCNMKFQAGKSSKEYDTQCPTTIQRYFFNKDGRGKLRYKDFHKFISGLQDEILHAEFFRYSLGGDHISPLQFAQAILRFADLPRKMKDKGLQNVAESISFEKDRIDFDSYSSFFHLLFRFEDLYSALKMYVISNRVISREEFQRAARAVTGKRMDDTIVDTVFLLFDSDGDGHLSAEEFIAVTRSYLARGTRGRLVEESKMQSFTSCVGTKMRTNF